MDKSATVTTFTLSKSFGVCKHWNTPVIRQFSVSVVVSKIWLILRFNTYYTLAIAISLNKVDFKMVALTSSRCVGAELIHSLHYMYLYSLSCWT